MRIRRRLFPAGASDGVSDPIQRAGARGSQGETGGAPGWASRRAAVEPDDQRPARRTRTGCYGGHGRGVSAAPRLRGAHTFEGGREVFVLTSEVRELLAKMLIRR